jgi:NitT/TauT family transport system substrate-binding protein
MPIGHSLPEEILAMKRAAFTALAAGLAGSSIVPAFAQSLVSIRFGTTAFESYALGIYAQEAGFFRKYGLDAQMSYFAGGGFVLTGLIGGALDYACINVGSTSSAHLKGVPLAVFAGGAMYNSGAPTAALVTSKSSPIRSGKDLTGKTVSITTLRDMQQASVLRWVDRDGGDSASVKFIELPLPTVASSVNSGHVDAGIISEPLLSAQRDDIRVLTASYDTIAKRFMIDLHVGMLDFLNRNVATTRKVIDALRDAAVWANANHSASAQILARVSKTPVDVILGMNRSEYATRLETAAVQPVIDATAQYRFLERSYQAQDVFWTAPA